MHEDELHPMEKSFRKQHNFPGKVCLKKETKALMTYTGQLVEQWKVGHVLQIGKHLDPTLRKDRR